jgi:D-glycero-D-manno-heptose 1,7-bisphosphate phosphatase
VLPFDGVHSVFLDRDGVINRKAPEGQFVARWEDFHLLPGVEEAIAALNRSGRRVFLVTNQRGVALGLYGRADVERLHVQLAAELAEHGAHIDGYYYCPHDKNSCTCRKPLPGLFEQAFAAFPDSKAAESVMIGDSVSDIEAGRSIGMRTIFIEGEPERRKAGAEKAALLADVVAASLAEAVDRFLP